MDGQQTSIYGTLPRAKRIRSRKDKKSPQQMAQIIADYIVYEAQQNSALAILLSCRLYTKPILLLKQLRIIWESEAQDEGIIVAENDIDGHDQCAKADHLPVEFLTLRRRPNRGNSRIYAELQNENRNRPKVLNRNISAPIWKSDDIDSQPFSSILADLKKITEKLAPQETKGDGISMRNNLEKSRDSGFGSFSNSIISETSSEESEHSTVFDNTEKRSSSGSVLNTSGYFPVTMTQIQKKISYLIHEWIRAAPATFSDTISNKILESFTRIITIHNPGAADWMTKLNIRLVNSSQFRQSIRRSKFKFTSDQSLYRITNDPIVMARHLMWIEVNLIKNLCQDELINQLICSDGISDSGETENFPNWRLNCSFFNTLTSSAQNSVLISSKSSECSKVINYLIDVAIGLCQAGNFNSAMAIALGLESKPVSRLSKFWKKQDPSKIAILKNLADPASNFKNYRDLFRLARRKSGISIPYLSLLAKDIYYNTTSLTFEINEIEKRALVIQKHVRQIRMPHESHNTTWTINDENIQNSILKNIYGLSIKHDDDLYYMSYKLESPQTNYEKDEYKKLKAQRKSKMF